MYAIRSYYAISDCSGASRQIASRAESLHAAVIRQNASVGNSSAGIEEMIANIASVTQNVDRITSYNVCYTKLLRFTVRELGAHFSLD